MCSRDSLSHQRQSQDGEGNDGSKQTNMKIWLFLGFLSFDAISSLTPLVANTSIKQQEGATLDHYTLYGSLSDLAVLAILRVVTAGCALVCSYYTDAAIPESPFELHHPSGERKTREELDNEALEEPCCPWFRRYASRPAFPCELVCLVSGFLSVAKCLVRLNEEIGGLSDSVPHHPIFWIALAMAAFCSTVEAAYLSFITKLVGECGRSRRQRRGGSSLTWMRRIGSNLSIPLLSGDSATEEVEEEMDVEEADDDLVDENVRGVSDITSDSTYKAKWSDLLALCVPDLHWIGFAFVFLLLAALAQIYIPKFTGNILDALTETYQNEDDDSNRTPIWDVPRLCVERSEKLVVASILCGVFSGTRWLNLYSGWWSCECSTTCQAHGCIAEPRYRIL